MRTSRILIILMLAPVAVGVAFAQGMVDPTRPPGSYAASGNGIAVGGPVLQSVMLSPGRKVAVISGETVPLGGRYGSARLVRLTESEAVLKDGPETTVLRMFPLVEKRVAGAKRGEVKKSPAGTIK